MYRPAGLLSVFSLPHLTLLNLDGDVRRSDFCAFASSFTSASGPLVSLNFPQICPDARDEADDSDREDQAAVAEEAAALCRAARRLLSRLPAVRDLHCDVGLISRALALPSSLREDASSGCCESLRRLTLSRNLSLFPFTAPPSFSQLTELVFEDFMMEANLEPLLAGCPQLLVLDCTVCPRWQVVLTAARCCPRLLDLTVRTTLHDSKADDAAVEPDVSIAFLPDLLALSLFESGKTEHRPPCNFSVLRHFTSQPHPELRFVNLEGHGLTADDVLSLACLPQLCHLRARHDWQSHIAEVDEARRRAGQQLRSRDAVGQPHRAQSLSSARANCEADEWEPPLGPHQRPEMRQRVLTKVANRRMRKNCLAAAEGVDWRRARAAFFAELQTCLQRTRPAESSTGKHE